MTELGIVQRGASSPLQQDNSAGTGRTHSHGDDTADLRDVLPLQLAEGGVGLEQRNMPCISLSRKSSTLASPQAARGVWPEMPGGGLEPSRFPQDQADRLCFWGATIGGNGGSGSDGCGQCWPRTRCSACQLSQHVERAIDVPRASYSSSAKNQSMKSRYRWGESSKS